LSTVPWTLAQWLRRASGEAAAARAVRSVARRPQDRPLRLAPRGARL